MKKLITKLVIITFLILNLGNLTYAQDYDEENANLQRILLKIQNTYLEEKENLENLYQECLANENGSIENCAKTKQEIETLQNTYDKEQFEIEEAIRKNTFNKNKEEELKIINEKIAEKTKELNGTDYQDEKDAILKEIEELETQKSNIENEEYNSANSYEEQQAQEQEEINTLIEEQSSNTFKQSSSTPTLIPKPDYIPGIDLSSPSSQKTTLTSSVLPRLGVAIIGFAGIIALIIIIVAGVRMLIAWGEEEDYTKAKDQILYAIVGLVISLLSYTIVKAIINFDIEETPKTEITQEN